MATFKIAVEAEVIQERGLLEPSPADIERVIGEQLEKEQIHVHVKQGSKFEGVRVEVKGARVRAERVGGTGC